MSPCNVVTNCYSEVYSEYPSLLRPLAILKSTVQCDPNGVFIISIISALCVFDVQVTDISKKVPHDPKGELF